MSTHCQQREFNYRVYFYHPYASDFETANAAKVEKNQAASLKMKKKLTESYLHFLIIPPLDEGI